MDQPSGRDAEPPRPSRAEQFRKTQAAIEERRHRAMANRQQYQPQIHEQVQRLFSEYQAPFYARIRGFGRQETLALAESTVLGLAAGTNRRLSDTETRALTEHFLSSVHNMLAWKWIMTGLAAYMTYRGRQTMRFPFLKPALKGGRFDPATGGPQVRIMWHTARFAAYYGAFWLMGEPVFQGGNFMRQNRAMNADPRLTALLTDTRRQAGEVSGVVDDASNRQYGETWKLEAQQEYSNADETYQPTSSQAQSQPSWPSTLRSQSDQQQSQSRQWDAADPNLDDASPTSSSFSSNGDANAGGTSTWDRIRQQSQHSPRLDRSQNRASWEASQRTGGWKRDDDAAPGYRGSNENYTYSAIDEERATAKSQAQKDFDELLERERRGADQERTSWVRR